MNSSLFVEYSGDIKTQFLEDWTQEVLWFLFLVLVLIGLLVPVHTVTGFLIDTLFKDPGKESFWVRLSTHLKNSSLGLLPVLPFSMSLIFVGLQLG